MRKPDFCLGENKGADQLRGNRLYRPVCVGPGRKPRRPVFSRRGSCYKNKDVADQKLTEV